MLTKNELQDEVDELRLALEETRAAESELGAARNEIAGLRADLERSEGQRGQLQTTLATLNETQTSLAELYAEKEERLLASLAAEAARMAEAGGRWAAEEERLRGELGEHKSAVAPLEAKVGGQQKQLSTQAGWVDQLLRERNEARTLAESRAAKIKSLDDQLARSGEQLRALSEAGNQSIVVGIIELLASRPGCWVAIAALVGMAAGIVYVVNSILAWLQPSESLLGR